MMDGPTISPLIDYAVIRTRKRFPTTELCIGRQRIVSIYAVDILKESEMPSMGSGGEETQEIVVKGSFKSRGMSVLKPGKSMGLLIGDGSRRQNVDVGLPFVVDVDNEGNVATDCGTIRVVIVQVTTEKVSV